MNWYVGVKTSRSHYVNKYMHTEAMLHSVCVCICVCRTEILYVCVSVRRCVISWLQGRSPSSDHDVCVKSVKIALMHCMLVPLALIHFDKCPLIIYTRRWERGRMGESQTDRQEQKEKESCKGKKMIGREKQKFFSFVFSSLSYDLTNTMSPQLDQQYPRFNYILNDF